MGHLQSSQDIVPFDLGKDLIQVDALRSEIPAPAAVPIPLSLKIGEGQALGSTMLDVSRATLRSMIFSSSLTLPGKLYCFKMSMA